MAILQKMRGAVGGLALPKQMPERKRFPFLIWHLGLLLLACGVLTCFTLRLSFGSLSRGIWKGYWENLWIPAANLALIFCLCLTLFALLGRAWLAFLVTAVVTLGIAVGNYYLIVIRTDPLMFRDLSCLPEALAITRTQSYRLPLTPRVLICVLGAVVLTVGLAFASRWRPRWRRSRIAGLALALAALACTVLAANSRRVYSLTWNSRHINTWSVTEVYVSRGIVYSFTRSIFTASGKPEGYSEKEAEKYLDSFVSEDIPADRRVDVFVIMRESYADLSRVPCKEGALDFSCYDWYHQLTAESVLAGTLVTNSFGGDTKNAERCFLTGCYEPQDWRRPVNSYVWYLKEQGYRTEGSHPFNGWFYNRRNVNRYLGFDRYVFREDVFDGLVGKTEIADDSVLFDVLWRMYASSDPSVPYFHYCVTYEGHGPFSTSEQTYDSRYVLRDADSADGVAMNNYLSGCAVRDEELKVLVDRFRASDRPVVLLLYGDHKPTLGGGAELYTTSAYTAFGMDVDLSSEEGFLHLYSTEYVIWMNDAAREKLGITDRGTAGPAISPCYLMNVLFDTLGWGKGPSYLQAMEEMMDVFPVCSTKGRTGKVGALMPAVPEALSEQYLRLRSASWYWLTHFRYKKQAEAMKKAG